MNEELQKKFSMENPSEPVHDTHNTMNRFFRNATEAIRIGMHRMLTTPSHLIFYPLLTLFKHLSSHQLRPYAPKGP